MVSPMSQSVLARKNEEEMREGHFRHLKKTEENRLNFGLISPERTKLIQNLGSNRICNLKLFF